MIDVKKMSEIAVEGVAEDMKKPMKNLIENALSKMNVL